jgi:hypothetical protein
MTYRPEVGFSLLQDDRGVSYFLSHDVTGVYSSAGAVEYNVMYVLLCSLEWAVILVGLTGRLNDIAVIPCLNV